MRFQITLLLLAFSQLEAQNRSKPHLTPYFDRVDESPAFFVDCLNTATTIASSGSSQWPIELSSIRVDGIALDSEATMGPGLTTEVKPGELWHGIIALRQSHLNFFPAAKSGALVRSAPRHPLTPGKHMISVKCQEVWSDDFPFYWEPKAD
jgi:hypothetical protein